MEGERRGKGRSMEQEGGENGNVDIKEGEEEIKGKRKGLEGRGEGNKVEREGEVEEIKGKGRRQKGVERECGQEWRWS